MRWIAVTGVNGFIGHNLVWDLLGGEPHPLAPRVEAVLGSDLNSSLNRETYQRFQSHPRLFFTVAKRLLDRLQDREREFGEPPLAIIHNGACSSTTETDPEVFRILNVEASQQLFTYCSQRSIPFLYASSASVYGDGSEGFSDAVEETSKYRPMNLYGRSKLDFDRWVLQQTQRPPVWFGLRYFNVFGPFEEHKKSQASILHWGRRQIENAGVLTLFRSTRPDLPDGLQQRDFVSVQDVCRVTFELLKMAQQKPILDQQGLFVNVGRGQPTTWLDMGKALFDVLEVEPRFQFVDMPKALEAHYQNYTCADLSSLRSLGITDPFLSPKEAFQQALERELRSSPFSFSP